MRLTTSLAAAALALTLTAGPALAQQGAQPGTATTKPAAPAVPEKQVSPSHLAIAKEVTVELGITRSFAQMVEQVQAQIRQIETTRPELKDDIEQILTGMKPEFDLQQQQMLNAAAQVFATYLTEQELKDLDTFFKTPSGLKYVQTQPQMMDAFVSKLKDWSDSMANYAFLRVRAELSKRGKTL